MNSVMYFRVNNKKQLKELKCYMYSRVANATKLKDRTSYLKVLVGAKKQKLLKEIDEMIGNKGTYCASVREISNRKE